MAGRIIPYSKIAHEMERQLELLLRSIVLEADKRVKIGSPVDTGRFRESWQVGQDVANGEPAPEGLFAATQDLGTGLQVVSDMKTTNYVAGKEEVGHVYHVHNNIVYAERLANGWSAQAKAGWIDLIAKKLQRVAVVNYEKIKREA